MFRKAFKALLLCAAVLLVCICSRGETAFKQPVYEGMQETENTFDTDFRECNTNDLSKRNDNHLKRISDCLKAAGEMDPGTISGVLPKVETADRARALIIAARLGEDGREALVSLFTDGIDSSDINEACTILYERLTDREIGLVADMTEKYAAVIRKYEEKEKLK